MAITLMPYFKHQRTRDELVRTLRKLAGYIPEHTAESHEQGWDALRSIVGRGR